MQQIVKVSIACLFLSCEVYAGTLGENPSFMMVSGISSSEEMCLTAADGGIDIDGTDVILEPCASAVAAGDGRELWQRLPNGQIANAIGKKCVGAAGDAVVLTSCDEGSAWETQANGQMKLARAGDYCLSQEGPAAGVEDAAARGAITASSTADNMAHGANMAVDGSSNTFWASALDPPGPVTVTVDLGGQKRVNAVAINWEFPAESFAVSVSTDGVKWSEVHATDSNVLSSSSVALGYIPAKRVKVVMHEAAGAFHGHAVYGIKSLVVSAARLRSIVEECGAAAKSTDARDKYFATYVGEFAPCSSKALRSELPSLEAARASVASVVSELAAVLPKLGSCRGAAVFANSAGVASHQLLRQVRAEVQSSAASGSQLASAVDSQNGIDAGAVAALLREARRVIIAARGALF